MHNDIEAPEQSAPTRHMSPSAHLSGHVPPQSRPVSQSSESESESEDDEEHGDANTPSLHIGGADGDVLGEALEGEAVADGARGEGGLVGAEVLCAH